MTAMQEVLDFLNSIEGAGYGGMASFEIARAHVRDAINPAQAAPEGDFYLVPREVIDQFPEININNYDHDDACALNAWGCEVVTSANPAGSPAHPSAECSCGLTAEGRCPVCLTLPSTERS